MNRRTRSMLAGLLLGTARIAAAQGGTTVRPADRIADHRLTDAAIAVVDASRSVIYYNPEILDRVGPVMATFILAHEDAHILLAHVRVLYGTTDAGRLRGLELDADCQAAKSLMSSSAVVIEAARFFAAQGASRMDEFHPSGAERSARILSCGLSTGRNGQTIPRSVRIDASGTIGPS